MQNSRAAYPNVSKSGSTSTGFEEKFVHIYKNIFSGLSPIHSKKHLGIQGQAELTRFWDELLLLKVNEGFLMQCISSSTELQLQTDLKLVINELFGACSMYLEDGNFIRVAHALETLVILFQEIFKKRFAEQGSMIISLISGSIEKANLFFSKLINRVADLLKRDDVPIPVKCLCLRLYFTILTTTDNINTNIIASYFFQNDVFNAIVAALTVKLAEDRRCLELDATLVLILLLLWRESENLYTGYLSSSGLPLLPFLQTAHSLLSYVTKVQQDFLTSSTSQNWSLTDSVVSLFGGLFGVASQSGETEKGANSSLDIITVEEELWLHSTSGAFLTYFLVYFSPLLKSSQVWQPSLNNDSFQSSAVVATSASSFNQVLRAFLSLCETSFRELSRQSQASAILQGKCCLNILRCLLESRESSEYLAMCDVEDFTFKQAPNGMAGLLYTIPFRSVVCVIVDFVGGILNTTPADLLDPDFYSRAVVLIPLAFSSLKMHGWQLSAHSIKWWQLWQGLMHLCEWIGKENVFQRPGASELAELLLGIVESCLGNSQDVSSAPEASEILCAMVMVHRDDLDTLMKRASSIRAPSQLINIASVKLHFEIQVAAMGIRGRPSHEQALQAVQKKGATNLKLKQRHAGPTHPYAEGTAELRLLINTARSLVAVRRKRSSLRLETQRLAC